jgi:hypothetical protein
MLSSTRALLTSVVDKFRLSLHFSSVTLSLPDAKHGAPFGNLLPGHLITAVHFHELSIISPTAIFHAHKKHFTSRT